MFHGLQLHLIGKSPLTGEQAFPLQVAVHHDDGGLVVVQVADNDRHGFFVRQFAGPVPPVPGDQLIPAARVRADDARDHHAVLADACGQLPQSFVVPHPERMPRERVQRVEGQPLQPGAFVVLALLCLHTICLLFPAVPASAARPDAGQNGCPIL